jgi:hypothetical protein
MAYGQRPGQYGQQEDTQRLGPYAQRGYDQGGQQAGGDGRWQSPDWTRLPLPRRQLAAIR